MRRLLRAKTRCILVVLSIFKNKKENTAFASLASERRAAGGQYKWARGGKTAEKSKKKGKGKREGKWGRFGRALINGSATGER